MKSELLQLERQAMWEKKFTLRNYANWPKIVSMIFGVFSQIRMKQLTFAFSNKPRETFQRISK